MPDADQLKAYLADRNVPCPGCGYNLRGVAEPVCPECGNDIDIERVRALDPRQSSESQGVVLYTLNLLTLGLFVLICALAIPLWISGESTAGDDHMVYINTVLAPGLVVVGIPAALLLVLLAKRSREWLDDVPELGLLLNPVTIVILCRVAFGFAEDLGRWMTGWM